ncbi:MAG: 16S rRNA (cytosine(967)-C(5))-methyltransferase RsmB [Ruminococcaceae bacterium]|nr:16S rRNA (cytosine(967)-C(5))-methyltransferase RsmB [Oscillospiraceae bacterium]
MAEQTLRAAVCELLLRCEAAGQYSNIALDTALSRGHFTGADRGLFTALFYSVTEHRLTLDHVIDTYSKLPASKIEPRVRAALRLGLCQLLYFDRIPDHAAINESVSLVPTRSRGFVNAILRGFLRAKGQFPLPDKTKEPVRYLSLAYSISEELAEAFLRIWGLNGAEKQLIAFSRVPDVTVRINTKKLTREDWLARFGGTPTEFAPHGVRFTDGEVLKKALSEGLCFVQDAASQICVAALDARGQRVLDLCAAPGSKSFGAALDGAAEVHSFDLHENKISLIRRGAATLGIENLTAAAQDAKTASSEKTGTYPRVLCDVPCSGFGVLAKKPDIRYKDVKSAEGLPRIQREILERAATCVEAGGILVYSTCTVLPAENEELVGAFLAAHKEFSLLPFSVGELHTDGMITLTPAVHGTDGFFVAKMQKGC